MNDLPTRLRTYRAHDATADALLDEAAVRIEELERIGRVIMDALYFQGREHIDFIELGAALHYDPWPEG